MTAPHIRKLVDDVSKKLTDEGKLIEAGFALYRQYVMSPTAPQIQIEECKWAFFAGAQHLFASIMSIMDEEHEPTEADMRRLDMIHTELAKFAKDIELRIQTEGKA
jgi:hypothetical protein